MTAFPPRAPCSLTDPETIRENDWASFTSLDRTINHWNRQGWWPGRRGYYWMLSFEHSRELRELSGRTQCLLQLPILDHAPTDSLHLTLGRVGFADELDADLVQRVLAAAQRHCRGLTCFPLTAGPLAGSRGAVRWTVSPWDDVVNLHRQLTAATRSVLAERCVMNTDTFRPHISIAYVNREVPAAELVAMVANLAPVEQVTVNVHTAALVILYREAHAYRLQTVSEVPLEAEPSDVRGQV